MYIYIRHTQSVCAYTSSYQMPVSYRCTFYMHLLCTYAYITYTDTSYTIYAHTEYVILYVHIHT